MMRNHGYSNDDIKNTFKVNTQGRQRSSIVVNRWVKRNWIWRRKMIKPICVVKRRLLRRKVWNWIDAILGNGPGLWCTGENFLVKSIKIFNLPNICKQILKKVKIIKEDKCSGTIGSRRSQTQTRLTTRRGTRSTWRARESIWTRPPARGENHEKNMRKRCKLLELLTAGNREAASPFLTLFRTHWNYSIMLPSCIIFYSFEIFSEK